MDKKGRYTPDKIAKLYIEKNAYYIFTMMFNKKYIALFVLAFFVVVFNFASIIFDVSTVDSGEVFGTLLIRFLVFYK